MARLAAQPSTATISSLLLFLLATANATNPLSLTSNPIVNATATFGAAVKVDPTQLLKTSSKKAHGAIAREFTDAHNKVRAGVNHAPLSWNKTLAMFARRWAEKRVADCKLIHSGGPYGENLFWSQLPHWTPAKVVAKWAEEEKYYDRTSNSCIGGQMCQHYSQIVWKSSRRLGCARVQCQSNRGFFVICNYDPPGNFKSESPFEEYPEN